VLCLKLDLNGTNSIMTVNGDKKIVSFYTLPFTVHSYVVLRTAATCPLFAYLILKVFQLPIRLLLSTPITNSDIYFKNVPIMIDFNPKIIIIFVIYFTTLNINFI
jgi:hypothetical protein